MKNLLAITFVFLLISVTEGNARDVFKWLPAGKDSFATYFIDFSKSIKQHGRIYHYMLYNLEEPTKDGSKSMEIYSYMECDDMTRYYISSNWFSKLDRSGSINGSYDDTGMEPLKIPSDSNEYFFWSNICMYDNEQFENFKDVSFE